MDSEGMYEREEKCVVFLAEMAVLCMHECVYTWALVHIIKDYNEYIPVIINKTRAHAGRWGGECKLQPVVTTPPPTASGVSNVMLPC